LEGKVHGQGAAGRTIKEWMVSRNRSKEFRREQGKVGKVKKRRPEGNTSSKFTTTKNKNRGEFALLHELEGTGTGSITSVEVREANGPPKEGLERIAGGAPEEEKGKGERNRETTRNIGFQWGKRRTGPEGMKEVRMIEPTSTRNLGLVAHAGGNRNSIVNYSPKDFFLRVVKFERPK
jgi:hypothetical protein